MAQQKHYQQVLELALAHILSTRTLAACCLVSQQLRDVAQNTVEHNLPRLIQHCQEAFPPEHDDLLRPLQWLCRQGAAAVNTSEAGRAIRLLLLGHVNESQEVPSPASVMSAAGLVMTNELLAFVAEHDWGRVLPDILAACDLSRVAAAYRCVAALQPQDEVSAEARATLSGVTAADLPALLRAACKRSPVYACLLIDHDRDHLHLLHPASNPSASPVATRSTRSRVHHLSAAQRQQQHPDESSNQLLMELLEHAVRQQNNVVLERLYKVPGAQQLSTLQVTRLLLLATSNAGEQLDLEWPCVLASLACLPGARGVSADCVATLLAHGLDSGCWESVLPLIHLPAAKRISSARLCRLLLAAAKAQLEDVFCELSGLADGRTLDSEDVVQVVKAFIAKTWHVVLRPRGMFMRCHRLPCWPGPWPPPGG